MRLLSLFSGIGTTEIAAHELGFKTAAFCEIDPFAQSILEKRFPCVPICTDIRSMRGDEFGAVDVVCGGFPCQDLSVAGVACAAHIGRTVCLRVTTDSDGREEPVESAKSAGELQSAADVWPVFEGDQNHGGGNAWIQCMTHSGAGSFWSAERSIWPRCFW